jgi:hypothetical protein
MAKATKGKGKGHGTLVTQYVHHKTGKLMKATDYKKKAFYFPPRKQKAVASADSVTVTVGQDAAAKNETRISCDGRVPFGVLSHSLEGKNKTSQKDNNMTKESILEVKEWKDCDSIERDDFHDFVLAGGEVDQAKLKDLIKKAHRLLFVRRPECLCLKGIAGIKNPRKDYRKYVFCIAEAPFDPAEFEYELGWIYVLPSMRRQGISYELVN